ncbi:DNA ligase [Neisseria zalophi]|uniref:DNA ligase n=1 Tax=Neisseria zalophi TaxID=640030 RepID=A0A5J6PWP0_9NEIS|nr:DNA ligase [Neisseria zalophi]QEY25513.1 DNA ligase [Neisseria zalophi]
MKTIILVCGLFFTQAVIAAAPDLLLAKKYTRTKHIQGWAMSEKLDGVRAYWDGKWLISRQGYPFTPPAGYTHYFPPYPLDGELFSKRGQFERISGAVRSATGDWSDIKLYVFDVPQAKGNLYQRLAVLQAWLETHSNAPIAVIAQTPVHNHVQVQAFLKQVEQQGGEGVMLRRPDIPYQGGRSPHLLKVKSRHDDECTVTRHYGGKGKYEGKLGALGCRNRYGEFRIGSGLKDKDRADPPPVGSIITYRYQGFTQKGIPRFATFLRVRHKVSD